MLPPPNTFSMQQQLEYLQSYKEAFMANDILAGIVSLLAEPLSQTERYVNGCKFNFDFNFNFNFIEITKEWYRY
jgi:hypothetical protein